MLPVVILHENTGQPGSCMAGLSRYAARIGASRMTDRFDSASAVRTWIWAQPILLDIGEGETEAGCIPAQRSRVWPKDGLNCWEGTAHWLGWHLRNRSPIEAHLFDSRINGQRHVFPAARYLGDTGEPTALVLQPPVTPGLRSRAQALASKAAQAISGFPRPLQVVGKKDYYGWDNPIDFSKQLAARYPGTRYGLLPEAVLQQLPQEWRHTRFDIAPTPQGDLLFLHFQPSWLAGAGTVWLLRAPASAFAAGPAGPQTPSGTGGGRPADAPPP